MQAQNCESSECCEGTQVLTPVSVANRPGLSALAYRVGTHARFLESMKARLSSLAIQSPDPLDPAKSTLSYPLRALTTRAPDDPSLALLDGWATIADILTFYQERIANEGFLRTATERRSVLELARLIGYVLRPGVSASVFLALDLDKGHDVLIQPREIKAQSIPAPGETPQTFENSEPLDARFEWNRLQPRLTRQQTIFTIDSPDANGFAHVYLKGVNTNLKVNDVLLVTLDTFPVKMYHVASAEPDPDHDRTLVTFQEQSSSLALAANALSTNKLLTLAEGYVASRPADERSEMAQRVVEHLNTLIEKLKTADQDPALSAGSLSETLAKIAEERNVAVGEQYTRLAPWLNEMHAALSAAHQELLGSGARVNASVLAAKAAAFEGFPDDPLQQSMLDLTKSASIPPRNTLNLDRSLASSFDVRADIGLQMSKTFDSKLSASLPATLANVQVTADSQVRVFAFRASARPFAHSAPLRATVTTGSPPSYDEWNINDPLGHDGTGDVILLANVHNPAPPSALAAPAASTTPPPSTPPAAAAAVPQQSSTKLFLDGEYKIQPNQGWVIADGPLVPSTPLIINLAVGDASVVHGSLGAYGISGKSTLLNLQNNKKWLDANNSDFSAVRTTRVHVESEELPLADEPLQAPICDGVSELIELDQLYSGMQSGRWVIISGERADVKDISGQSISSVKSSELVMLAEVIQDVTSDDGKPFFYTRNHLPAGSDLASQWSSDLPLAGDRTHTWVRLAKKLEFCYQRDKVSFYGNVLKATNGETQKESLGNGDASQAFQSFMLKQFPLTYTSSPTPAGAESSLAVYVNDVLWHESATLAGLAPADRKFITKTDDAGKTTLIFGNGQRGARLPTGLGNIRAEYRNGIGRPGNVAAEQISLLMSKPLGVQTVINPLRASGGADRESMDTARKNAPLTVTALDRLVSLSDYADFARTFAGVGKSSSAQLSNGQRQVAHVTIAGADDIPIDETSDLFQNLLLALRTFGAADLPVTLQLRELLLIVISANIRIHPDYQWDPVSKAVRARLLDVFSFERRELGQDVRLSEVLAAIQSVRGVIYVDVDILGGVPEKIPAVVDGKTIRRLLTPQEVSQVVQTLINGVSNTNRIRLRQPLQRIPVNLAAFEAGGTLRPAQLAYLTPDVADTLVLNQVK